jgi:hypothetical protein
MTALYIDNNRMYAEYKEWKIKYNEAIEAGIEKPEIPRYLADSILLICNRLSNRYNFVGYSYRDEMVADAVLECVKYFHCFNPDLSSSVFSYFTKVAFQAFVGRINKEHKQSYIKGKIVQSIDISEIVNLASDDSIDGVVDVARMGYMTDTAAFEKKLERKRKKNTVTVGDFISEDDGGREASVA